MKRKISFLMAAAITALAAVPQLPSFADTKNQAENVEGEPSVFSAEDPSPTDGSDPYSRSLIIYELGDERVPTMEPDAVVHDLNAQYDPSPTDSGVPCDRSLIIYELGDERVPTMEPDAVVHVLEE